MLPSPLELPGTPPAYGNVVLRAFRQSDTSMLLDLSSDPYVALTGTLPHRTDHAGAAAYIERQRHRLHTGAGYSFCIALHPGDQAVGQIGLWLYGLEHGHASAGYCVAPRFRGRHLASQALLALTEFAWSIPEIHRLELYIEPWNEASSRTAVAAGFVHEGLLRSHQSIGERRVDMHIFSILRPDPTRALP